MNEQPITVIIPAKNAASSIRSAVSSTLRGLPSGSRVLVRSDGSTDATADLIRSLGDPRVEVVESAESIGVAASLNQLLDLIDTPLVARMDADDIVLPGRWSAQTHALRSGADIAFTPVINWFAGTPLIKPQRLEPVVGAIAPLMLLVDNPFMHPTMLARTSILRDLGGYRPVPSEDYELWLRAAARGARLERAAVPRVIYRRHPGQVTAQVAWRASRSETSLVEQSFLRLGELQLGFTPSWFAWRRDGFPVEAIPDGVLAELDELESRAAHVPPAHRRPLLRRLAQMREHAAKGNR